MVIESLNKLGRLDLAIDRMEQRLPIELFAIVDKTNQEVDQRHPGHLREQPKPEKGMVDFDLDGNSGRSQVLKDLLWTLYSKFEAIAEGHRAVHDVVAGIVKREGLRHSEPLTRGFKELWKLYQSEVSAQNCPPSRMQLKSSRCGRYCMTTWLQTQTLPIGQAVSLMRKLTSSKGTHGTRPR